MKILLINPPRSPENKILEYAPADARPFIHKKLIGPPLGLLTIAAVVKDFDVTLIDLKGEYDLDPDAPPLEQLILRYLSEYQPDIVGVTFIASELYAGLDIFRAAKKFNPEIITVAGGLHVTICPEDFADPCVDILCPGHSAGIFRKLVINFEKGLPLENTAGIILNEHGTLRRTTKPAMDWDPAGKDFILPDRSHLTRWLQTYKVGNDPTPVTYLFTSLGCPFECSFCAIWPQHDKQYYMREVESVIEELKGLDDYGVVRFADANTIVDIRFIHRLVDRILEEGIVKKYVMDIRPDTAARHPDLIEKLALAGLKVVICGFESFRDEELDKYNKRSAASNIKKSIEVFHRNDIMIRGNYIVPNDYGEDDFKALAAYSASNPVVYAGYTILTPMPGTVYYREVKDQIVDHDLSKYNFFNSVMKTKLPPDQFYESVGSLWKIKLGKDVI
ncbi:MAG: cobalamin-dependent protein [Bacteroidales bacterium]|nr:cobalamin-dependent protein [Bacteroidales bacterium]